MGRFAVAVVFFTAGLWVGVLVMQGLHAPTAPAERFLLGSVALGTIGVHLRNIWAAGSRPGGRAVEGGPSWVAVQAERHRRLATRWAAWGLGASALAGLAACWAPTGGVVPSWVPRLTAGVNLGLQPGLLLAEGWAIMARGRLVRSAGSPA